MPTGRRNSSRSRRAILDAAARAVIEHGSGVSLGAIAREAGVSKGGLLHHFGSREALLLQVVDDQARQFWQAVKASTDPVDRDAGRLARGYVRATTDSSSRTVSTVDFVLLGSALSSVPGVAELVRDITVRWRGELMADGLDRDRVMLITSAADGTAVAKAWRDEKAEQHAAGTRDLLLGLSRHDPRLSSGQQ